MSTALGFALFSNFLFSKLQNNNAVLIVACAKNDLAMISLLIKAGAYPNTCNKV